MADKAKVVITVGADGPLEVTGDAEVRAADGTVISEAERLFLCRCGQSAKKPFCDGSHRKVGFHDAGLGT